MHVLLELVCPPQNDIIADIMERIDNYDEETCLQVHLATGSGPWERARLAGELRNLPGLADLRLDHSPSARPILGQLQEFASALRPIPLKINIRSPRPGQSYHSWLFCLILELGGSSEVELR